MRGRGRRNQPGGTVTVPKKIDLEKVSEIIVDKEKTGKSINEGSRDFGTTLLHQIVVNFSVYDNQLNPLLIEGIKLALAAGADPAAVTRDQLMPFDYVCTRFYFEEGLSANLNAFKKEYAKLLQQYCPIDKMIVHVEKGLLSFYDINTSQLNMAALEELGKWCDRLIEKGTPDRMILVGCFTELQGLKEKCENRIRFLTNYPNLEPVLEKFLRPSCEALIFRAFHLDSELRHIFNHLLEFHKEIGITSYWSQQLFALAEKYQAEAAIFTKWKGTTTPLNFGETKLEEYFIQSFKVAAIERTELNDCYAARKRGNWDQEAPLLKELIERHQAIPEVEKQKKQHVLGEMMAFNSSQSTEQAPRPSFFRQHRSNDKEKSKEWRYSL